ncbi:MAG: hypothetical protein ACYSOY_06455, partial [Planctomycetota bacterium]
QLAFANTIEGIRKGANLLDASLYGIGRGAGNCALELLLGFLKNPKLHDPVCCDGNPEPAPTGGDPDASNG